MLSKTKALTLDQLSDESQLLVLLSWFKLSEKQKEQLKVLSKKKIDWERFMQLAIRTHLAALIYTNEGKLDFSVLPEAVRQKFKAYQFKILSFNTVLYHDFDRFQQKCNEEGILSIPLKGIYFAEKIYRDIGIRQISDLDILVSRQELTQLKEVLTAMGWKTRETLYKSSFHQKHFEFASPFMAMNGRNIIDFHLELFDKGKGFFIPFQKLSKKFRSGKLGDLDVLELDPNDNLIYMCLHLYKHLQDDRIKLSSYADIAYFIQKMDSGLDAQTFWERCREFDVISPVSLVLTTVRNLWMPQNDTFFQDFVSDQTNALFDRFFLQELGDRTLRFSDRFQKNVINRLFRGDFNWTKILLIWYDIFPSAKFLQNTMGGHYYWRNWAHHKLNWFKRF